MSNANDNITQVAERLFDARTSKTPTDPVSPLLETVDDAYRAQEVNTERWLADGRRLVGRKIGLTSTSVQQQLGVHEPDYGMLFADMSVDEACEIEAGRLLQPKAEAEIAFVLDADLPNVDTTAAEMMRAVDFVVAAIEVVDSRVADWNISLLDTVADNASSGLYVLGSRPANLTDVDLLSCGMVMERRGPGLAERAWAARSVQRHGWLEQWHASADPCRPVTPFSPGRSARWSPLSPVTWSRLASRVSDQ